MKLSLDELAHLLIVPPPMHAKPHVVEEQGQASGSPFERLGDLAGMSLRDVRNDTRTRAYCNLTAVAAITGHPISLVKDGFRQARYGAAWTSLARAPIIRRTSWYEISTVLGFFGYEGQWHRIEDRPTFARFLDMRTDPMRRYPCIVQSNRWLALSGWQVCDAYTHGQVVEADDAPWRRARVHRVCVVSKRVSTSTPIIRKKQGQ